MDNLKSNKIARTLDIDDDVETEVKSQNYMAGFVGDKLVRTLDFDDDTVPAVDSPMYTTSARKEVISPLGRVVCGGSGGVDLVDIMQDDNSYGKN
eukprot:3291829-Ditylum_brightwellii.AAC.1